MATIDPHDQYAAPDSSLQSAVPLMIREVSFFLILEKRIASVIAEEARCDVDVCSHELGMILDLCNRAMARIGAALSICEPGEPA